MVGRQNKVKVLDKLSYSFSMAIWEFCTYITLDYAILFAATNNLYLYVNNSLPAGAAIKILTPSKLPFFPL